MGGEFLDERGDEPVEFGDFVVEVQDPAGEVFEREFGGEHRVAVSDDILNRPGFPGDSTR